MTFKNTVCAVKKCTLYLSFLESKTVFADVMEYFKISLLGVPTENHDKGHVN